MFHCCCRTITIIWSFHTKSLSWGHKRRRYILLRHGFIVTATFFFFSNPNLAKLLQQIKTLSAPHPFFYFFLHIVEHFQVTFTCPVTLLSFQLLKKKCSCLCYTTGLTLAVAVIQSNKLQYEAIVKHDKW